MGEKTISEMTVRGNVRKIKDKTARDHLKHAEEEIEYVGKGGLTQKPTYYQQSVNGDTGEIDDSNVQIRTQFMFIGKGNFINLSTVNSYKTHVRWYNDPDVSTFVSGENSVSGLIMAPADYLIVVVTAPDWGNITPSAGTNATIVSYAIQARPKAVFLSVPTFVEGQYNIPTCVNIDLDSKVIRFGNATSGDGRVYLMYGNKLFNVGNKTVDFSNLTGTEYFLFYNVPSDDFVVTQYGALDLLNKNAEYIYCGMIWGKYRYVDMEVIPYFYVNGIRATPNDMKAMFSADRSYGYATFNMAVIGDSTSTYDGISEDEIGGREVRGPYYPTGTVNSSDKMWWAVLRKMLRFGGATNVSAISRSRYMSDIDADGIYAPATWNDERIARTHMNDDWPNYIFILAGINDGFSSNTSGSFMYNNAVSDIEDEPVTTARGIELTIRKVQTINPRARIVLIIPWTPSYSTEYNWESFYKNCELIKQIGEAYNVYCIVDLRKSGIHQFSSYFTFDGIHPNALGMQHIAAFIYDTMTSQPQPIMN